MSSLVADTLKTRLGAAVSFTDDIIVVGYATVTQDLQVEGDLNITGDLSYDEVTGRNINITGIGTIVQEFNVGTGGSVLYAAQDGTIRLGTATTAATVTLNGGSIPSVGLVIALGG